MAEAIAIVCGLELQNLLKLHKTMQIAQRRNMPKKHKFQKQNMHNVHNAKICPKSTSSRMWKFPQNAQIEKVQNAQTAQGKTMR